MVWVWECVSMFFFFFFLLLLKLLDHVRVTEAWRCSLGASCSWVGYRKTHVCTHTEHTHTERERKALQDKILYLYSLWPSVPWCLSVCVCLFDCFTVSLLIASDIYVRGLFKALMLITCYLPRMSAVITVTQQYWVTWLQTRMSRPQPDPIRPHFLSITQEPLWLAPVIDAECVRLLKGHRIAFSGDESDHADRLSKPDTLLEELLLRFKYVDSFKSVEQIVWEPLTNHFLSLTSWHILIVRPVKRKDS